MIYMVAHEAKEPLHTEAEVCLLRNQPHLFLAALHTHCTSRGAAVQARLAHRYFAYGVEQRTSLSLQL